MDEGVQLDQRSLAITRAERTWTEFHDGIAFTARALTAELAAQQRSCILWSGRTDPNGLPSFFGAPQPPTIIISETVFDRRQGTMQWQVSVWSNVSPVLDREPRMIRYWYKLCSAAGHRRVFTNAASAIAAAVEHCRHFDRVRHPDLMVAT